MEGSLRELAGYRMEKAREMLSAADGNLEIGQYKTSLNLLIMRFSMRCVQLTL